LRLLADSCELGLRSNRGLGLTIVVSPCHLPHKYKCKEIHDAFL
jgi:hypothetical protein